MTMPLRAFNEMFPDEDAARAWFERSRWSHGPECYHCGAGGNATYMPKTKFWHCKSCKEQFSVKHFRRYTGEATFRWNRRADSCLDRMTRMILNGEGRLLPYAFLTGEAA